MKRQRPRRLQRHRKLICPSRLSPAAKQAWREVVAELNRRGVELLPSYQKQLAAYCMAHVASTALAEWLAKYGSQCEVRHDGTVSVDGIRFKEKAEGLVHFYRRLANDIAAEFYLSPRDRHRIHHMKPLLNAWRRPGRNG